VSVTDADPEVGTLLGNQYRLIEIIGEGGMGLIYRARQEMVDRDVAVKVLRSRFASDENIVGRFVNEAKIISQLRHPNTLRLYDYQRMPNGGFFIVTEYLQGESLQALLSRGPLGLERALHISEQICGSLSEAHAAGIVHRDLKPANIFLDRVAGDDYVKVLDFGIAKLTQGSIVHTQTNIIMGTPAYMSPEQVRGETLDSRSDIYAVGVILFHMLVGRTPFHHDNAVSLLMMHVNDPPPPLPEDLDAPPEIGMLIFELLSKTPAHRPKSVVEVRDRLRALIKGSGATTPQRPAQQRATPPPKADSGAPTLSSLPPQPGRSPIKRKPSLGLDRPFDDSVNVKGLEMFLDEPIPERVESARVKQSSSGGGALIVLLLLAAVGGGGWYVVREKNIDVRALFSSLTADAPKKAPEEPAPVADPPKPEIEAKPTPEPSPSPEPAREKEETTSGKKAQGIDPLEAATEKILRDLPPDTATSAATTTGAASPRR
jgi:serine/threonine-protein kinase